MEEINRFGKGEIYKIEEILENLRDKENAKVYCECSACMSVYSDFLSWIAASNHRQYMTADPSQASVIIIVGCQVTDLAIHNDIARRSSSR